jgi:type IX secretion system PorP/SprF family membrane protein
VKRTLLIMGILYTCISNYGQDPQLTQFYSSPMYLAPSFAGATQQHRIASTYRNQWPGIPNSKLVTYLFSYDHYFANFNSGVGLLFMRDVAGSGNLSTTNIGVQYSYDFKITDFWHMRPGVHFNYTQTGLDFYKLLWGDQLNPSGTPVGTIQIPLERSYPDIDFGTSALTYTDRMWFGISVAHLLRPNISLNKDEDERLPVKVSVFGGYQIINKGRLLKPVDETLSTAFLYKRQGIDNMLDIGLYWYKNPLVFGFWYRGLPIFGSGDIGDAIAFLVGYKIEQFSIGYSYDFTISQLLLNSHGSHEISLIYEFTTTRKKTKRHMVPCPEF